MLLSLCGADVAGFNKEGYNKEGFNKEGFNKEGYNRYIHELSANHTSWVGAAPSKLHTECALACLGLLCQQS